MLLVEIAVSIVSSKMQCTYTVNAMMEYIAKRGDLRIAARRNDEEKAMYPPWMLQHLGSSLWLDILTSSL